MNCFIQWKHKRTLPYNVDHLKIEKIWLCDVHKCTYPIDSCIDISGGYCGPNYVDEHNQLNMSHYFFGQNLVSLNHSYDSFNQIETEPEFGLN